MGRLHEGFFLAIFKNLIKEWMGGSYIAMKITPSVPHDITLITIRYMSKSSKPLKLIPT